MRAFVLTLILGIAALGTVAVTPAQVRAENRTDDGFNAATTVPVRWWRGGSHWGRGWGWGGFYRPYYGGWGGWGGGYYGGFYRPYYGGWGGYGYYPSYSSFYYPGYSNFSYGYGYPYTSYYYSRPGFAFWW